MQKMKKGPALWVTYILLFMGAFCMLFPFIWMFLSSFKSAQEIIRIPPTIFPEKITFENYTTLWNMFDFGKYFFNSIFITVATVSVQLYTSALFGYVLGKFKFRGNKLIFSLVLFCMMVPGTINVIPKYQMMVWFKWINSYKSLILTDMVSLFGIFMIRQFSSNLPNEMIESARMDGAGELKIFHRICLPMFKNPLSALAILQFLWVWDSLLWPMLMLNDVEKYTITLGLSALNGQYSNPMELMITGACVAVIPVLIVYIIFQRRFIEGMAGASVKG